MNTPDGFRQRELKPEKELVTLNPVADVVDIKSTKELITLTFIISHLDKNELPNHQMILSSVIIHRDLAKKVAESLMRHANRGNIEANIKIHPLPPGMKLPEEKK